jgi:hypothetical protein
MTAHSYATVVALLLLQGCPSPAQPTQSPAEAASALPAGLSEAVLDKVCQMPCPGPGSVTLLRNADKELSRILFRGDLEQCSHVSWVWFDVDGKERLSLDDRPVENNGQAQKNARLRGELEAGLTEAEHLDCPAPEKASTDPDAEALQRADFAASALQQTLKEGLVAKMKADGPAAAAAFCAVQAQGMTDNASAEATVGRSSLRLRNPQNKGPAWVHGWLLAQGERPAEGVAGLSVIDELADGTRVARVLKPIAVQPPCLNCHGAAEALNVDVKAVLAQHYPDDQATGYAIGDLRGALWAEVPVVP